MYENRIGFFSLVKTVYIALGLWSETICLLKTESAGEFCPWQPKQRLAT